MNDERRTSLERAKGRPIGALDKVWWDGSDLRASAAKIIEWGLDHVRIEVRFGRDDKNGVQAWFCVVNKETGEDPGDDYSHPCPPDCP